VSNKAVLAKLASEKLEENRSYRRREKLEEAAEVNVTS